MSLEKQFNSIESKLDAAIDALNKVAETLSKEVLE